MFTKGEWINKGIFEVETDGYRFLGEEKRKDYFVECNGRTVAQIGGWADRTNTKDDANLISAAPDMYEALKALVTHFRMNDENYYKSDLCTNAIQALAKAEGRQ